jgi:uncharacterized protein (TIGR02145 family)/uncharacterized repeat protein (TIGR02543 family)
MNSDKPLVAMFNLVDLPGATTHTLVTTAFPENGGSVSPAGNTTHNTGTQVTITASPNEGYTFSGWSGASTSVSSYVTITMDASKTLVAMFTPVEYTLTVNSNPEAGGTVFVNGTALAGASRQDAGMVEVLAQPAAGYVFTGWSGARTETSNPITINITGDGYRLTANFERAGQHTLAVSAGDGGTATGGGTFPEGTNAQITASANAGYRFSNWSGNGIASPTSANTTVLMDASKTVTANFEIIPCGVNNWNAVECIGSFIDERDEKIYRTTRIGTQTWMAENLNWAGVGGGLGWCYGNDVSNCDLYGRLYDWNTVMAGSPSSSASPSGVRGVCPSGWHVPSDAEWTTLTNYVGFSSAGTKLKSATGWYTGSGYIPGTDDFGFSALPGGSGFDVGSFSNDVGTDGRWWSATETYGVFQTEGDAILARNRDMVYFASNVVSGSPFKAYLFSLRCLQD